MHQSLTAIYAIILLGFFTITCDNPTDHAELILLNGKIITADDANPQAEAVAIAGDRILAVGTNQDIKKLSGRSSKIMDLKGKLVIPGLIEGHAHFMSFGYSKLKLVLGPAKDWDEVVAMVAKAVETAPPGSWILGRGWHQEKWEKIPSLNVDGYPVHDLLSQAAPEHPVYLTHASGHGIIANKKAMQLAGITSKTPDPLGGTILHMPKGEPSGVFLENADTLITNHYSKYLAQLSGAEKEARKKKALNLANTSCLALGITGFHDAGVSYSEIDFYKKMIDENEIDVRLWVMLEEENAQLKDSIAHYKIIGYGNNKLTVRSIKRYMDGALGAHGAWLLEPYEDLPESTGLNTIDIEVFKETAEIAVQNGFQLCTHAIGDRGNRETLDIYEEIFQKNPDKSDLRWRIEHAQHLHPDDISRFAQIGVIPCMQSIHCTSDGPWVPKKLGTKRSQEGAYVWRELIRSGAVISNGTDAPVERINPFENFYAAITRKMKNGDVFYKNQVMTRIEALHSYTINPAHTAFEDHIKGSITPGKLADIIVLSQDIMTIPEDDIPETKVIYTIIGGKFLYKKSE